QPGTASSRPAEPRHEQRGQRPQQQRRDRPERHGRPSRPNNNGQQQRPGGPKPWQERSASHQQTERDRHRGQGFQRRNNVPAAPGVGIGITAALLWAARRAGGWRNLQTDAADRARQGYDYAREGYGKARDVIAERAARFKEQPATLPE